MLSSWSSTTRTRGFLLRSIVFAEESLDFSDDRPRLTGLVEIPVTADFHRLLAVGREGVRSQRNDWDLLGGGLVLQHLGCLTAVMDRVRDHLEDRIRMCG